MPKNAIIIGGGVSGLSAAEALAGQGVKSLIIEKECSLGGEAVTYGCKATDECSRCNVCLALDLVRKSQNEPLISVLTESRVTAVDGEAGDFTVTVENNGDLKQFEAGVIIAATGFEPFAAETMGAYGLGSYSQVISSYQLEQELSERTISDILADITEIAFLQCIGSRDRQNGNPYCSRICCGYALRLAKLIKSKNPETDISFFYMDLQNFGKSPDQFKRSCDELGINFIRGKGSEIKGRNNSGKVDVIYEDLINGRRKSMPFELVVLSVGLTPRSGASKLSRILGINRDQYGFFGVSPQEANRDEVLTSRPGVLAAGTCQGPRDAAESIAHGKKAALKAISLLRGRSVWKTG